MPWDGALPMLRHGPLQLQVIAFPVSPPLLSFFPPPSSCPSPSVLFSKVRGAAAGLRASARSSPSRVLLPFVSGSLRLSLPLRWNLLYEMAVVQRRRSLTALRVCACEHGRALACVREGEADGENLSAREREREKVFSSVVGVFRVCQEKAQNCSHYESKCLQLSLLPLPPLPSRMMLLFSLSFKDAGCTLHCNMPTAPLIIW